MSMQDTMADMLTRIRNAQMAEKVQVEIPASKARSCSQSTEGRGLHC